MTNMKAGYTRVIIESIIIKTVSTVYTAGSSYHKLYIPFIH